MLHLSEVFSTFLEGIQGIVIALVALVLAFALLFVLVIFLHRLSTENDAKLADGTDDPPSHSPSEGGSERGDVGISEPEKVARTIEVSSKIFESIVQDLEGTVLCREVTNGHNSEVTFYARKEFYPLGKYQLSDSPTASRLAEGIASINDEFEKNVISNFWATTQVLGAADAVIPNRNIDYDGMEIPCDILGKGKRRLVKGIGALDNDLLACARAAVFAQYLVDRGLPRSQILVSGNSAEYEGGRFRYVDVTVTFHNVRRWNEDIKFCPG